MKLQDVFCMHHGQRAPHLQDWRLKGPGFVYAVPRGPMYSANGKHWEACDVSSERDEPKQT